MKTGIDYISAERKRQVNEEGYDAHGDINYAFGELAQAAATYSMPKERRLIAFCDGDPIINAEGNVIPKSWPFSFSSWKPTPKDRIRELSKAGALIAAEIDRLLTMQEGGKE